MEIIGYKLNGKISAEEVASLLNCMPDVRNGLFFQKHHLKSNAVIKAKSLGILDLWFEAVYKKDEEKTKINKSIDAAYVLYCINNPSENTIYKDWTSGYLQAIKDSVIKITC